MFSCAGSEDKELTEKPCFDYTDISIWSSCCDRGRGFQTLAHGGDLLWTVGGTAFVKLNDGGFTALTKNRNLAVVEDRIDGI